MTVVAGKDGSAIRIGVDGLNLAMAEGTGVATYGRGLCDALKTLGYSVDGLFGLDVSRRAPDAVREILFFNALGAEPPGPAKRTLRRLIKRAFLSPAARHLVEVPLSGKVIASPFGDRLPAFERLFTLGNMFGVATRYFRRYGHFMPVVISEPPAIMHWTYPVPIRLAGAANIYTIHDCVPLRLPYTSTEDKQYHFRLIERCLDTADHICTVSESSRRDLLAFFPDADESRITNTYQSVFIAQDADDVASVELEAELDRLFDLQRDGYFLYFGAIEPKKNLGRLIEAYLRSDIALPLVIVGSRGWRSDGELRLLNGAHGSSLKGLSRIRRLDHLPRGLLMLLVRGARAVTFPSLYEGFGLPVLEAMSLGAPVLTSNISSLPEVAGEAALKVDPYDVNAIAAALLRLDGDADLRRHLAAAGPKQAATFAPAGYAGRIARVYGKILKR